MKQSIPRVLLKSLKIAGMVTGSLILLMFLLPYLFPGFVSTRIRHWARTSICTELNFSKARLSFFRHFPALTLTLHDVRLDGSAPFEKDALIEADEISLGVDIRSIFSEVTINKIFLTNAFINIQTDTAGRTNYNVYAAPKATATTNPSDSGSASLKIEKILIEKSKLVYNDRSLPILINARDVNYEGNADLSKAVFDLHTHMEVGSMDLYYDRQSWFVSKKINADLVTKINTNSLALLFEKNELLINQLPVVFTGRFEFLKDGYDMDFRLKASNAGLHDVFTAMPPAVLDWLNRTEVKGVGDIDAALTGHYISASHTMPDLSLDMKIRDGYIADIGAPSAIQHLFLNFRSRIPGMNPDSLTATADSLFFNIDRDYLGAVLQIKGLKEPWVKARINSAMDLEKWSKAVGLAAYDLKGRFDCRVTAEGKYATRIVRTQTLRKTKIDTVVASIPTFTIKSSLSNGYFKYATSPEPVRDISFDLDASCADNNYKHTRLAIEHLNAAVLTNFIRGYFRLGNARDFPIDAGLETVFHLSDIKKVCPLDSMELAGNLTMRVHTKGKYVPAKKLFPWTVADLKLDSGSVKTKYYPHPLENIQVSAHITNAGTTLKDLDVTLTPVSFRFEGQPFTLKADLHNFTDLRYNIISRGLLDIGKIYRVFALQGYDLKGVVEANLSLKGSQSDAIAGRYDQLFNSGTLKVRDLQVSSELFPQPFFIRTGLFRFDQDKMWFDDFKASYGKTELALNGWLSNVIGYMTDKHTPLQGSFSLNSDHLYLDEFAAFSPTPAKPGGSGASPGGPTGVIIIPGDLAVSFKADVKKIQYNGIELRDFTGMLDIDSSRIRLDTTRFTMIGTPVEMDAQYGSLSPQKAAFQYHINAKDFDVQRAYKEIRLFHDLASSASKAQGIISLNYQLAGRMDGSMHPVYPSLKGGGVLAISNVKMKGLKLFSAVSQETNKDVADPDLTKVEIKSTINNNIITIARTRMKVSIFKLRMEGQASFDGKLNLRFRVGLPPFGVIGIPLKITGTQEKPIVKGGRGSKKDELEETEDKGEDGQEN